MACHGETHKGRIDPCLDDAIEARQIAHRGRPEDYAADQGWPSDCRYNTAGQFIMMMHEYDRHSQSGKDGLTKGLGWTPMGANSPPLAGRWRYLI